MLHQTIFPIEGYALTRLLKNRGRTRDTFSRILTAKMQKKLLALKSGSLSLPTIGTSLLPAVSLTSWLPRYNSLPLVLLNLLDQDLLPSQIIVWLSFKDYALLDRSTLNLFEQSIVQFRQTDDYGSHKKWLPMTLETNKPFVICDDDVFYPKSWYRKLISSDDGQTYVAHKCHRLAVSSNSKEIISPYSSWEKDIHRVKQPSHRLFAVGCGGTLIYPERLSPKFRDWSTISRLCPKADDIWLKLAHLDSGVPCRKSNYSFPCIEYAGSQTVSLFQTNVDGGGNDVQFRQALAELDIDMSLLL